MTPLSPQDIERFARHIVLRGMGADGQRKLKDARVLVLGAGGLGSPALQYLAAAGVGGVTLIDDDAVSLSNLQRQVLHGTQDVGRLKIDSAREALARLNPAMRFEGRAARLEPGNARALARGHDVALDGSDNFAARYAISDACFHEAVPLVMGAVGAFDAALTTLRPFARDARGEWNPTYRCLYPQAPPEGALPACSSAGVLGPVTGMLGAMMALEAIREIVGFGEGLVGRLLLIDCWSMRFETIGYARDARNPLNGAAALAASART